MRDPDFFIIGAPKCGTTSLSEYLRTHPRVFMTSPKEPHHFNKDMPGRLKIADNDDYRALFQDADDSYAAVGEASVHYLRSKVAIPALLVDYPDARFVAMVRNPITFLPSWHNQLVYSLTEPVTDFEEAWRLQEDRRQGRHLPRNAKYPEIFDYLAAARFGEQARRLLDQVPRDRVLFLKFEDFTTDTRGAYLKVLDFLGVADDGKTAFTRANAAHQHKSRALSKALDATYKTFRSIRLPQCHRPVRRMARDGLLRIMRYNRTYRKPQPMPPQLAQEVYRQLQDDIRLLEHLTGLDLGGWRPPSELPMMPNHGPEHPENKPPPRHGRNP